MNVMNVIVWRHCSCPQVFHCLELLAAGSVDAATPGGPATCPLRCGCGPLAGGALGAMLHAAEVHALQVYELSRAAAAEAVPENPGKAKTRR